MVRRALNFAEFTNRCILSQMCQIDHPSRSKFEEMIQNPNFTAKTHYFAQRLEELRKLHQFYKNLAKQAPRRNPSPFANCGSTLPDLLNMPSEDLLADDATNVIDPFLLPDPPFTTDGTLSSLKIDPEYSFDWKSLLPDEIEVTSEVGDPKMDLDETASDLSKDISETIYDIQSDIMPYLPSNYISLSSLSATKPPDLIMTSFANDACSQLVNTENGDANADYPQSPKKDSAKSNIQSSNVLSLSDDETNVKQIKGKKDKRKKKQSGNGLLSGKKDSTNVDIDNSHSTTFGKINWSRFFGGCPKKNNSSKDGTPKKSSKSSNRSSGKSLNGKNGDKPEKRTKEHHRISSREPRIHGDIEVPKTTIIPLRPEMDGKVKGYKSSSSRKSSSNGSPKISYTSSHKRENNTYHKGSPKQVESVSSLYKIGKQDPNGRSKNSFQRDSLCVHPGTSSTSSSVIYPGYDSGADSGVGMRVSDSLDTLKFLFFVHSNSKSLNIE